MQRAGGRRRGGGNGSRARQTARASDTPQGENCVLSFKSKACMRCGEGTHENVRRLILVVQLVEELVDSSVLVRQLVNAKEVQIPIHGQHERPRKELAPRRRRRSEGEDRVNRSEVQKVTKVRIAARRG